MLKKPVFKNFTEYWYYARYLSREQRKIIFRSLPSEQKEYLDSSYIKEGWCALFYRNEINEKIDELKDAYGFDVLNIRLKALSGKSVYVPSKFWQIAEEQLGQWKPEDTNFATGGLKAVPCENSKETSLIIYDLTE